MTVFSAGNSNQIVHFADSNYRMRAQIAMLVSQSGGHAEIYEDIKELVEIQPQSGTILLYDKSGDKAAIVPKIQANSVFLPVILFSENPTPSRVIHAAHKGVADYLNWPFSGDELMEACVYAQEFMTAKVEAVLQKKRARQLVASLTDRERQILAHMLEGHSNKSMGSALHLSPRTIEFYRRNAMKKLGVTAPGAAIRIGIEAGLEELLASSPASDPRLS